MSVASKPRTVPAAALSQAKRALRAADSKDATEFASLVHPEAVDEFHKQHAGMLVLEQEMRGVSSEFRPILASLHDVKNVEEFSELDPARVLLRFLRTLWAENNKDSQFEPSARRAVLGAIAEHPDVHVVYRATYPSRARSSTIAVLTLRKSGTSWRCLLNAEILSEGQVDFALSTNQGGLNQVQ